MKNKAEQMYSSSINPSKRIRAIPQILIENEIEIVTNIKN
jgi:hypothetical protein